MNIVKNAVQIVLKEKKYIFSTVFVGLFLFVLATWLANIRLIFTVFADSGAPFFDKLKLLVALFGSLATNFTVLAASYTFLIAVLFGLNVSMLAFYISKNKKIAEKSGVVGFGGLVSGVFGVGCATCGTLIVGSLLAMIGVGGVLAYFPFGGQEFGILGVILLLFSIYLISKKISKPAVCKAPSKKQ